MILDRILDWVGLHAWQIAAFVFLTEGGQLERERHWYVWFPVQLIGFVMMDEYAKRYHP